MYFTRLRQVNKAADGNRKSMVGFGHLENQILFPYVMKYIFAIRLE